MTKETAVKTLELPNYALAVLYRILGVPLHGPLCRARNRIAKIIEERITSLEDERVRILESYAEKDEAGKPKYIGEGKEEQYDLTPESLKKYRDEFDACMKELFILDLLPSVKADIAMIRPLVLETSIPFDMQGGKLYEELASAFEKI